MRFLVLAGLTVAQFAPAIAQTPPKPAAHQAPAPSGGPFDALRFRSIGPASMSGRIDDLAVLERDSRIFYVASATGGLWKTVNNGVTFTAVFDSAGGMVSIGAVAIGPDDPNRVWVGTGEPNNRQSSSWGDGIYLSTDGGISWKNMGLKESKQIARIVVDPVDPDIVYVAALGDLWKGGGERGIYKTLDGGVTWTKVLDAGPDAGGTELVMDPSTNKVLYAAMYQRRRSSWGMNGGGPNSGIWKSSDAGRTWTRLTKGIPEGSLGRIGLDVWRRNPSVLYARIEHEKESGVYRSDDAGASWRKMGSVNGRPMYFGVIKVDPENDLRVYLPMTPLGVSDDGGKTFRMDGAPNVHVDYHAMWINPKDPEHMLTGNDGGVALTRDRGKTWLWFPNLPVGQFYHVGFDMEEPYNVCGGLQDNSSWCGPSRVRSSAGITNHHWRTVQGGDGFVGLIDPTNHRIIYAESQDGFITRVDKVTNEGQSIRPEAPEGEKAYRWNWDTPMMLSPHDPATIYVGANRLLMSSDRGMTWKAASPDLTTGLDRDTVDLMGAKGKDIKLAKNDGVSVYGTLFTIAESRKRRGLLYTGSDDGQVNVSRDGGATWANVTSKIPGAPKWSYVSKVEPSKFDEGTVYVTFDGHRTGDYGTYLYQSTDYGSSWRSIAANLPPGQVVRTITEDTKVPDLLYVGTETGLFVSTDRGKSWVRFKANLPTVPIYEVTLHPRDNAMILATHGRAIWILDDLRPLQQYAGAQGVDAFLYDLPPAVYRSAANDRQDDAEGDMRFLGQNPLVGVQISYQLNTKADSVRLVITDPSGAVVRKLEGDTTKAKTAKGMNSLLWNLRTEPIAPAKKRTGPAPGSLAAIFGGAPSDPGTPGPIVLPGDYRVTLVVNGKEIAAKTVAVRGDPDVTITAEDRQNRQQLLRELQRLEAAASDAGDALRTADQQLKAIKAELADSTTIPPPIKATLDSLTNDLKPLKKLFGIREPDEDFDFSEFRTILPFRLGMLSGNVGGAMAPPTATNRQVAAELQRGVNKAVTDVNAFLGRLKPFYQRLAADGLYPPVPATVRMP